MTDRDREKLSEHRGLRLAELKEFCNEYQRLYMAELYAWRKAQGLCVSCGNRARAGKAMCSDCLVRNVSKGRSRRKRRVALGLCIFCAGAKPSRPGRQTCIDCAAGLAVCYRKRKDAEIKVQS